jgi:hypothetical protein
LSQLYLLVLEKDGIKLDRDKFLDILKRENKIRENFITDDMLYDKRNIKNWSDVTKGFYNGEELYCITYTIPREEIQRREKKRKKNKLLNIVSLMLVLSGILLFLSGHLILKDIVLSICGIAVLTIAIVFWLLLIITFSSLEDWCMTPGKLGWSPSVIHLIHRKYKETFRYQDIDEENATIVGLKIFIYTPLTLSMGLIWWLLAGKKWPLYPFLPVMGHLAVNMIEGWTVALGGQVDEHSYGEWWQTLFPSMYTIVYSVNYFGNPLLLADIFFLGWLLGGIIFPAWRAPAIF